MQGHHYIVTYRIKDDCFIDAKNDNEAEDIFYENKEKYIDLDSVEILDISLSEYDLD